MSNNEGLRLHNEQLRNMTAAKRIGEKNVMKSGLTATILNYRTKRNIDVIFDNGHISYNRQYVDFRRGNIYCPLIVEHIDDYAKVTNANIFPPLTFLVDIDDLEFVKTQFWCRNDKGYVQSLKTKLHRKIVKAKPNELVDHINRNILDNRKSNLRICTNAQNSRNSGARKNNKSGYKGVQIRPGSNKWMASIGVDDKNIHLGDYIDKKDAALAYNKAALKYHGDFASLNEID